MKVQSHFCKEKDAREVHELDSKYVLNFLEKHEDRKFRAATQKHESLRDYPFAICMPRADRDLDDAIRHDHIAGNPEMLNTVKDIMRQLARAVDYIHSRGLIHGDLKPLNVVRIGEVWKIIDLDAATKIGDEAGSKISSAYAPPELLRQRPGQKLLAKASFDVWSFGIVLFQLVTGEMLFPHA